MEASARAKKGREQSRRAVLPNSRDKVQGTPDVKAKKKRERSSQEEEGRWKRAWQTHLSAVGPVLVALSPAGKISGPNSRARSFLRKSPR